MKTVLLILVCCMVSICTAHSQTYAITLDAPNSELPVNKKTLDDMLAKLKSSLQSNAFLYDVGYRELSVDTSFNKNPEVACDYLLTVFFEVYENYEPELTFARDTNKKITHAYFPAGVLTRYNIVMTDLRTDEMVQFASKQGQSFDESNKPKTIAVPIEEVHKAFPGGPDAVRLRSKTEYAKAEQKLQSAYKAKLQAHYMEHRLPVQNYVLGVINKMKPTKLHVISNPLIENGKLKGFEFTPESVKGYDKEDWLPVFTLDTLGDYIYPNFYKYWEVDEIVGNKVKAGTHFLIPSENKDAGEALAAGKILYTSNQEHPFSMCTAKEDPIIIDVQGADLHKEIEVFKFLARSPRMKIINSMQADIVGRFHERYKGGQFVDSGYGLTPLGAQVILSGSDADYQLLDARSGTVLGRTPKSYGDKGIFDLFQKALDLKIRIIKPIDQKKDVLKSALVYSPIGFYDQFYFDVMQVTPEQVNGKTIYRESEIGRGNIYTVGSYGYHFAEAKFNKGEKEIYAAYNNKQSLLFVSHEFKFPFIGTFK
jgi:hypothetical protein